MSLRPVLAAVVASASCLTLAPAVHARDEPLPTVHATVETPAVFDDAADGDADADDPAIWRDERRPQRSVVLGTLKSGGVAAYDLRGRLLQRVATVPAPSEGLEAGRYNNVDLARGVLTRSGRVDLAVVSDRGRDRVRTFRIDPRGSAAPGGRVLTEVTSPTAPRVFAPDEAAVEDQETAYGLAAHVRDGVATVAVSQRHRTAVRTLRLVPRADGTFGYQRVATVRLPSSFRLRDGSTWSPCEDPGEQPQVEGMVVHRSGRVLLAAQEDVGIWRIPLDRGRPGQPRLVERVREYGTPATHDAASEECVPTGPAPRDAGRNLAADAEGLTIAYPERGRPVLLASSQGDSTFSGYRLRGRGLDHLGSFAIGDGRVDGVQHSDGATVLLEPLGPAFPQGLLVTHDGEETPVRQDPSGAERVSTGFTLTPWPRVARALGTWFTG